MPNKTSTILFDLIHSMDKNEKRYFRLFSSLQQGSKKYEQLFELIAEQDRYDETAIRSALNASLAGQLPSLKNYLYNLLLKALIQYNSQNSIDAMHRLLTGQIEVLYAKGLFDEAGRVLKKALQHAAKYEKHYHALELIEWQKRLFQSALFKKIKKKQVEELAKKEVYYTGLATETGRAWLSSARIYTHYLQKGVARNKRDKKEYDLLIGNDPDASSITGKQAFLYKQLSMNRLENGKGELLSSYKAAEKLKAYFEDHPSLILSDPMLYCIAFYNFLFQSLQLKKFDKALSLLSTFRNIPADYNITYHYHIRNYIRVTSLNLELLVHLETGEFSSGIALAPQAVLIEKYALSRNPMFWTYITYNLSYHFFGEQEYNHALHWYNKSLSTNREDVEHIMMLYELILHFELENFDVVSYRIQSVYRRLLKQNKLYQIEKLIVSLFQTVLKSKTKEERELAFSEVLAQLLLLKNNSLEAHFLSFFDFISWLESKIQHRPFKTIVKEKRLVLLKLNV